MKREVYDYLAKLPARIMAGAGTPITAWSAGDPSGFQKWWGWAVSPDHIRIGGIIGVVLCTVYWLALIALKPAKEEEPAAAGPSATGERANAVGGNQNIGHQGDVYHLPPTAPAKPIVDARFENVIKLGPPSTFTIMTRVEDRSSREFAWSAGAALVRNGWKCRDMGTFSETQTFNGVLLRGSIDALRSTDADTLIKAFAAAGITLELATFESWPADFLRLDFGAI